MAPTGTNAPTSSVTPAPTSTPVPTCEGCCNIQLNIQCSGSTDSPCSWVGDTDGSCCAPSDSTVHRMPMGVDTSESKAGHRARIDELRIGDQILSARSDGTLYYDTVSAFSIADHSTRALFFAISHDAVPQAHPVHRLYTLRLLCQVHTKCTPLPARACVDSDAQCAQSEIPGRIGHSANHCLSSAFALLHLRCRSSYTTWDVYTTSILPL